MLQGESVMDNAEWKKDGGPVCGNCRQEYFRGRDGLCYRCWEKENEFEIRDHVGLLSLVDRTVIMKIARKTKTRS